MSKVKPPKSKGIPSKHLHARTTFLYQAATYLTLQTPSNETTNDLRRESQGASAGSHASPTRSSLAMRFCSDLQQVSRKGQLRMTMEMKRTLCKCCHTILVPGRTATQTVENTSKGGKKPWADVLILECSTCGGKKRFPVGAKKQLKRAERKVVSTNTTFIATPNDMQPESEVQTSTELDSNTG